MDFNRCCEEKSYHDAADRDMSMSIYSSASIAENPMLCAVHFSESVFFDLFNIAFRLRRSFKSEVQ